MNEGEYPEHDKLQLIADKSQAIGEFLEWLQEEKQLVICQSADEHYYPHFVRKEELLADFFEIDLKKLDDEKRAMLKEYRKTYE